MNTITRIDYAAARERLQSVTTDAATLASFDHVRETGELEDTFMKVVVDLDISLNWLLLGKGVAHREGCRDGRRGVDVRKFATRT